MRGTIPAPLAALALLVAIAPPSIAATESEPNDSCTSFDYATGTDDGVVGATDPDDYWALPQTLYAGMVVADTLEASGLQIFLKVDHGACAVVATGTGSQPRFTYTIPASTAPNTYFFDIHYPFTSSFRGYENHGIAYQNDAGSANDVAGAASCVHAVSSGSLTGTITPHDDDCYVVAVPALSIMTATLTTVCNSSSPDFDLQIVGEASSSNPGCASDTVTCFTLLGASARLDVSDGSGSSFSGGAYSLQVTVLASTPAVGLPACG